MMKFLEIGKQHGMYTHINMRDSRKNARFLRNEEEPAREASLGVHMRLDAATGEWNQKRDMKGGGKLVSQSAGVARDTRNLPNRENGNRLISDK
jgi:hypothetical protein